MKRWWLALALILSLGVNVGILATLALRRPPPPPDLAPGGEVAPPDGPGEERPPRERHHAALLERLVQRLGLEGEAREQFVAIQQRFFERQGGLRGQLEEVQRELRQEVTAADPDPEALEALLTRLHRLQFERDRLWIESIVESRKVLTPEQEQAYLRFVAFITRRAFEERLHGGPRGHRGRGALPPIR